MLLNGPGLVCLCLFYNHRVVAQRWEDIPVAWHASTLIDSQTVWNWWFSRRVLRFSKERESPGLFGNIFFSRPVRILRRCFLLPVNPCYCPIPGVVQMLVVRGLSFPQGGGAMTRVLIESGANRWVLVGGPWWEGLVLKLVGAKEYIWASLSSVIKWGTVSWQKTPGTLCFSSSIYDIHNIIL